MACRPIERLNKVAMGLSAERPDIRKRSDLLYFAVGQFYMVAIHSISTTSPKALNSTSRILPRWFLPRSS